MTEIEKQEIEEMAEVIAKEIVNRINVDFGEKCQDCDFANTTNIELSIDSQAIANALFKAGYRKQSDVAREFGERAIKPISQVEQTASVREKSAENYYLKNYFQGYRIGCATAIIKIKEVAAEFGVEGNNEI